MIFSHDSKTLAKAFEERSKVFEASTHGLTQDTQGQFPARGSTPLRNLFMSNRRSGSSRTASWSETEAGKAGDRLDDLVRLP